QDDEGEIEGDRAEPQRRDEPAQRLDGRVGHGVDRLGDDQDHPRGLPVPCEHLDPVEDESPEQREQEEQHHEVGDAEQDLHAAQLWLKNRACCCAGVVSSEATSTVAGESRNTLFVTRSMAPRRPKTSPAEKSTSRFASASPISVRFMMTGVPARNASPM